MIHYDPFGSAHITETVREMVAMAEAANDAVWTEFNGVKLVALPGMSEGQVVSRYEALYAWQRREYESSPEYAMSQVDLAAKQLDAMRSAFVRAFVPDDRPDSPQ